MTIPSFMGEAALSFLPSFLHHNSDILSPDFEFLDHTKDSVSTLWRGRVRNALELGVLRGDHAATILDLMRPHHLYLTDPWDITDPHYGSAKAQQQNYDYVRTRFRNNPKVTVTRAQSYLDVQRYPAQSMDWIFVDADHRYHCNLLDLVLCNRIMKTDGALTGHDFSNKFGIPEAVAEFCRHYPWLLQALTQGPNSVFVLKHT